MNTKFESKHIRPWPIAISLAVITMMGFGTSSAWDDEDHRLTLHSSTFEDGGTLPLSMINTIPTASGTNSCTASGANGGNQSPQLTWRHAPRETRSFAVVAYDVTAQFTHWQMYNIAPERTGLPENAGVSGSTLGTQNGNDFLQTAYSGPCPPTTLQPLSHKYEFTVYALDIVLPTVPAFGDFVPAGAEGLYQELIKAAQRGHVLASATISGNFSAATDD
jgi:Raf kinase inhibitor-like YbhB/YbcL family protein